MRHQFEVGRVAAKALIAEVIHLLLPWDIPIEVGEHDEMHSDGLTVECHSSVATTTAIARGGAGPEMTGAWLGSLVEPHVLDLYPGQDPFEDPVPSIYSSMAWLHPTPLMGLFLISSSVMRVRLRTKKKLMCPLWVNCTPALVPWSLILAMMPALPSLVLTASPVMIFLVVMSIPKKISPPPFREAGLSVAGSGVEFGQLLEQILLRGRAQLLVLLRLQGFE